jgi:hypothetical protein
LLVDLTALDLSRSTPLALLDPSAPPILPDPLPSSLETAPAEENESSPLADERDEAPLEVQSSIPGSTFDASVLEKGEDRSRFHRNLAAVTAILTGEKLEHVAKAHQMATSTLWRLVQRTRALGQIACVPYATYQRDRQLRPEFRELIRKLYMHPRRPTVMEISEDVRLKRLAEDVSEREGALVPIPPYWQVWAFVQEISSEMKVIEARSGLKHSPRERTSPHSFVLSIAAPALICQVDEHTLDLLVVTPDGTVVTRRVHAAVLICVKTAAIMGAVLALDSLTEEDYMRLVKQSLEPKDRLTALYECKHPWPCYGKPSVIFHDRGKIFTSERARQVLVERFHIVTEQAPPYAPSANDLVAYCTPSA